MKLERKDKPDGRKKRFQLLLNNTFQLKNMCAKITCGNNDLKGALVYYHPEFMIKKRNARMQIYKYNHNELTTQEERKFSESRRQEKAPREEKHVTKETCVNKCF